MTVDMQTSTFQTDVMIQSLMEALFNANLHIILPGQTARDSKGDILEQFSFQSTWTTYNKLIKDIQRFVGSTVFPSVDPDRGCDIYHRQIETTQHEGKNFTTFVFSVDPRGFRVDDPIDPVSIPLFRTCDVIRSMFETVGVGTEMITKEKYLELFNKHQVEDLARASFNWKNLNELVDNVTKMVSKHTLPFKQRPRILILSCTDHLEPAPNSNLTVLEYCVEFPNF